MATSEGLTLRQHMNRALFYKGGTFYVRDNWEGKGYRLYHGEDGALGERMEDGTHRFVTQVHGEINGIVFRTIRAAREYCEREFGATPLRVF